MKDTKEVQGIHFRKPERSPRKFVSDATLCFPGDPVRCVYIPTNHLPKSLVDKIRDSMYKFKHLHILIKNTDKLFPSRLIETCGMSTDDK